MGIAENGRKFLNFPNNLHEIPFLLCLLLVISLPESELPIGNIFAIYSARGFPFKEFPPFSTINGIPSWNPFAI